MAPIYCARGDPSSNSDPAPYLSVYTVYMFTVYILYHKIHYIVQVNALQDALHFVIIYFSSCIYTSLLYGKVINMFLQQNFISPFKFCKKKDFQDHQDFFIVTLMTIQHIYCTLKKKVQDSICNNFHSEISTF